MLSQALIALNACYHIHWQLQILGITFIDNPKYKLSPSVVYKGGQQIVILHKSCQDVNQNFLAMNNNSYIDWYTGPRLQIVYQLICVGAPPHPLTACNVAICNTKSIKNGWWGLLPTFNNSFIVHFSSGQVGRGLQWLYHKASQNQVSYGNFRTSWWGAILISLLIFGIFNLVIRIWSVSQPVRPDYLGNKRN